MEEGQVELAIPARTLNLDITVLIICFNGDVRVSRRYAGEPKLSTFLVLCRLSDATFPKFFPVGAVIFGWDCLAVEVTAWKYDVTIQLEPYARYRTGWACDLCENDRGAVHSASVGFLDLRLYKKRKCLPNTEMGHTFLARGVRFEDKSICGNCEKFAYYKSICRHTYPPLEEGWID